jgi:alpha-glucoside transport system permease protein
MILKIANAVIAIVGGVGASLALFWLMNFLVERVPGKWGDRLKPWVFAGPAVVFIAILLVYPAVRTIWVSFLGQGGDSFVGFANYTSLLGDPSFYSLILNTLLWLAVVPAFAVALGLLVATLADKVGPQGEKISKSLIFLPMAISMVGASTIWRFIYEYKPPGQEQIGILNALWTAVGGEPQVWLQLSTARVNSFLLMAILIWLQVGYCMVLLSAAIKGVPEDTVEAARMDGATELQAFFRVVVPQIWGTVITVYITVFILTMKIFDIVYVTTNGNFETNVVALAFFKELFEFSNDGRSAAIVVLLLLAVIPVMIYQVRRFRAEEAMR